MKKSLPIYQVDAFSNQLFKGNPAAVVPLEKWLPDEIMQNIAMENNLSETAFFISQGDGFSIRWFTPSTEVKLCGHATLASAHVLYNHLGYNGITINFHSKKGLLTVKRDNDILQLDFPAAALNEVPVPEKLIEALGKKPVGCFIGGDDLLALFQNEKEIRELAPRYEILSKLPYRGIIVTSESMQVDFVSRFFAPAVGVNEDPVTGSAHTLLIPFWASILDKHDMIAHQVSKRGGVLFCKNMGERVLIAGNAVTYLIGEISVSF